MLECRSPRRWQKLGDLNCGHLLLSPPPVGWTVARACRGCGFHWTGGNLGLPRGADNACLQHWLLWSVGKLQVGWLTGMVNPSPGGLAAHQGQPLAQVGWLTGDG